MRQNQTWLCSNLILSLRFCVFAFQIFVAVFVFSTFVKAQAVYEGLPISDVEILLEDSASTPGIVNQFEGIVRGVLTERFSAVKNREALEALFKSGKVAGARIETRKVESPRGVILQFIIRRTNQVDQIFIQIGDHAGDKVTEDELRVRLNVLANDAVITQRKIDESRDAIQNYLRERGFFKAAVESKLEPKSTREARSNITFFVSPNEQAKVENFTINVKGFDSSKIQNDLKLKPGAFYSRQKLTDDIARVRRELVRQGFLAADLREPDTRYDSDKNTVSIVLNGSVNARVTVKIENERGKEINFSERSLRELLPIKREGEIDQSSIEEGRRRLITRFQEQGYFFAEVEAVCAVDPFRPEDANIFTNNTQTACDFLDGLNLEGRSISVVYRAFLNRRFTLRELRLEGTNQLTIDDVRPILKSQTANALGVIPRLGYGRGFTSREILDDDARVIRSLMRELGYENASVRVRQGVSPEGEDLIITFVVREGALTRVSDVEITGNTKFSNAQISAELPNLIGQPYSRTRTRNGNNKILNLYARNGFIEAKSTFARVEQPSPNPQTEKRVKIVYDITNEGDKTFVNQISIVGNNRTQRKAVLQTIPLEPGDLLQANKLSESERSLYATDAFRQVTVTSEPAGRTANGDARRDVVIELQEQPSRILSYGGGYSTDSGANGFADIRYVNLFGKLYQGGAQVRASRRQQLVQFDFTNPRFLRESNATFAPLTITAQYLRDTGVTRFFRTTLDKGTFGIVQRLDENGNPIDSFGARTGAPSINRYSLNLETSRTLNQKTRSLLFVRYRFENVILININSLLVAPLLQPDRNIRISGFGATFARDMRQNCNNRQSLLEKIRTGEEADPCRYNATDPTRGDFLSLDYQLSARFLGANTSFNKFQGTYQRYQQFDTKYGKLVLAGRAILGLANVFQARDRNGNGVIDEQDKTLPISERFFAGGSTNLRGFDFEEAGPRRVIVPTGQFRDRNNNPIFLSPFTVPVGGNALAIFNLEARIPLASFFQAVPFYDGGNVFRRPSEIFKPRTVTAGDIESANLRAVWSNTLGLGFRFGTSFGKFAIDYGYILNPPSFVVPQTPPNPNAFYKLRQGIVHFRFTQAF
jgi:outer membrane protein assembly complex protein YaeT